MLAKLTTRYRRRFQIERSSSRWGLAALTVVLFIVFQFAYGNFATVGNALNILTNSVPTLIAAIPFARLIIAGNVDLSIAGSYGLLSVICGMTLNATGNVPMAIGATLISGAILGVVNGLLVNFLKISPIIVTIGLGGIYAGLALTVTNGASLLNFPGPFVAIAQNITVGTQNSLLIGIVLFVVGSWFLTRTVSGVRSYAIGGNALASKLVGVRVERHVVLLFVVMQVSMGVAAIVTASQSATATPQTGTGFEIAVLTAVMLGGVAFTGGAGRPLGIFFGVVLINVVQAGFVFAGFNSYIQQLAQGALLVIALAADQILTRRRAASKPKTDELEEATTSTDVDEELRAAFQRRDIGPVVLDARGLKKSYGSVAAVRDVGLTLHSGEILCLAGDNGAGKSTVIKMLSGVEKPDGGIIDVSNEPVSFDNPTQARATGIETVHQELAVSPNLGAALNMVLGREPHMRGIPFIKVLDRKAALEIAQVRLAKLGVSRITDYVRPVAQMSGGQRQSVAIARAARDDIKIVILDEPTAALGVKQTANVLNLIRRLASQGTGVILITHDVQTILEIADRIVVLNLGRILFDGERSTVTEPELIHLMAGYDIRSQAGEDSAPLLSH